MSKFLKFQLLVKQICQFVQSICFYLFLNQVTKKIEILEAQLTLKNMAGGGDVARHRERIWRRRDVIMGKIQVRPLQWWAESAPPGWDRVKVSENLGATAVAPVAPADTSLGYVVSYQRVSQKLVLQTFSNEGALPMHRDVSAGATGATTVAPKFSDTLTLSQPGGADSAHHRRGRN